MLADEKKTQQLGRLQTRLEFALASFAVFFSGRPERNAAVVHMEHPEPTIKRSRRKRGNKERKSGGWKK